MGAAIAKAYAFDSATPVGSGGHCDLLKIYDATDKKTGAPATVFLLDAERLALLTQGESKGKRAALLEVLKKDVANLQEIGGGHSILKVLWVPEGSAAGSSSSFMSSMSSLGRSAGSPELAFATERVCCSLLNETERFATAGAAALSQPELANGLGNLCEALHHLRASTWREAAGKRWVHLGLCPENVWLTATGCWRLGGFGHALALKPEEASTLCPHWVGAAGSGGVSAAAATSISSVAPLRLAPRLVYAAPECTAEAAPRVSPATDIWALGALMYELYRSSASASPNGCSLLNCGDESVARHRAAVTALPTTLEPLLQRLPPAVPPLLRMLLADQIGARPDPGSIMAHQVFQTAPVVMLRTLHDLQSKDVAAAANFLGTLPALMATDEVTDRIITRTCVPVLLAACAADPQLWAWAAPVALTVLRQVKPPPPVLLDALGEILSGASKAPPSALLLLTSESELFLSATSAAFCGAHLIPALVRAMARPTEPSDGQLHEMALDRLGSLFPKLADLPGASAACSGGLLLGVCKLVVQSPVLGTKIAALKTLATLVEHPSAVPRQRIVEVVLPSLSKTNKETSGQGRTPGLTMCLLGCFDLVAKRLPEPSRLAREILPRLVPLLDEKQLNRKQLDMVAQRVQALLTRIVDARREECEQLTGSAPVDVGPAWMAKPTGASSPPAPPREPSPGLPPRPTLGSFPTAPAPAPFSMPPAPALAPAPAPARHGAASPPPPSSHDPFAAIGSTTPMAPSVTGGLGGMGWIAPTNGGMGGMGMGSMAPTATAGDPFGNAMLVPGTAIGTAPRPSAAPAPAPASGDSGFSFM